MPYVLRWNAGCPVAVTGCCAPAVWTATVALVVAGEADATGAAAITPAAAAIGTDAVALVVAAGVEDDTAETDGVAGGAVIGATGGAALRV